MVMVGITGYNAPMPHNLDISLLRTFVATSDFGSMTAAGNALHLTQSAVSQQIARLEQVFGDTLVIRDRRGLRITAAGERLLAKARRMLVLNDEIWTDMNPRTAGGKVRLGAPYDLVATCLPSILKTYTEAFPAVEISLLCASSPELIEITTKGEIDLAIVEEPVTEARGPSLAVDRLVWVGANGGSAHRKTPLPVSMVAPNCAFRPVVVSALQDASREWRPIFESGSIDATTATVRNDLAVTMWLSSTVPADLDILPAEAGLPPLPSFAISLRTSGTTPSATATRLADHIRGGFAEFGKKSAKRHGQEGLEDVESAREDYHR